MPVTENVMKLGNFSLALKPGTPLGFLNNIEFFRQIVITDVPIDARLLTGNPEASGAAIRYMGIIRKRPDRYTVEGIGLVGWLGDDQHKGPAISVGGKLGEIPAAGIANWLPSCTGGTPAQSGLGGVNYGPVSSGHTLVSTVPGTWGGLDADSHMIGFGDMNHRDGLDVLCRVFGGGLEYLMCTDLHVQVGYPDDLYGATPKHLITPYMGASDLNITSHGATDIEVATDVEDWCCGVDMVAGTDWGEQGFGVERPGSRFRGPRGYDLGMMRFTSSNGTSQADTDTLQRLGDSIIDQFGDVRKTFTVSAASWDIPSRLAIDLPNGHGQATVGQWLYIWHPKFPELQDTANAVFFRGQQINPLKIRLYGATWSIRRGMGVYYRDVSAGSGNVFVPGDLTDGTPSWTDISRYVAWESDDTTLEVGTASRPPYLQDGDNSQFPSSGSPLVGV